MEACFMVAVFAGAPCFMLLLATRSLPALVFVGIAALAMVCLTVERTAKAIFGSKT